VATVTLRGRIKRFRFQKPGWCIAEVEVLSGAGVEGQPIHTCVGPLDNVSEGEPADFEGEWQEHPKYGPQFRVDSVTPAIPRDAKGVMGFLERLPLIGPKRAEAIIEAFGADNVFDIIESQPAKLASVKGLTVDAIGEIRRSYEEQRNRRDTIVLLKKLGITDWQLAKIFEWAGKQAKKQGSEQSVHNPNHVARRTFIVEALQKNPYVWTEIRGFGFATVDRIALASGVKRNSPNRAAAAVEHALEQAANLGHCFLPRRELAQLVDELTGIRGETYATAIQSLSTRHRIRVIETAGEDAIYGYRLANAERRVGAFFADRAGALTLAGLDELKPTGPVDGKVLNEEQQLAVALACHPRVRSMVMTGGPGRGKTTTVRAICDRLQTSLLLCSPTGKAAKRLAEQSGREAQTMHRALAWSPVDNTWMFNEQAPLPHDTIIIDEASMIDVELCDALTKAIKPETRLIFVGDVDQLPSVGPGNVLRDLIDSRAVPTVRLEQIYRQSERSYIAVNAGHINRGEDLELDPNAEDFFWHPHASADDAFAKALDLVKNVIPERHGADPIRDVQVLAPQRKGTLGIYHFNAELQPLPQGHCVPRGRQGAPHEEQLRPAGDER
jgi:exodeoxyribonuclease V alpha subunit